MGLHRPSLPALDLAPDIQNLLDPRNPRDWLRLLAWTMWQPTALGAYVQWLAAHGEQPPPSTMAFAAWRGWWRANCKMRLPLIMSALFALLTTVVLTALLWLLLRPAITLQTVYIPLALLALGELIVLLCGLFVLVATSKIAPSAIAFVTSGASMGALIAMLGLNSSPNSVLYATLFGLLFGTAIGGACYTVLEDTHSDLLAHSTLRQFLLLVAIAALAYAVVILPILSLAVATSAIGLLSGFLVSMLAFLTVALRLDNWVWGVLVFAPNRKDKQGQLDWQLARATPLPLPALQQKLTDWLKQDWKAGLANLEEVDRYSRQQLIVSRALQDALAETDDKVLTRNVAHLAEQTEIGRRDLLRALPREEKWLVGHSHGRVQRPANRKEREKAINANQALRVKREPFVSTLPTDTHPRAAVAGFWYMNQRYPERAAEAFGKAGASADEMEKITRTLGEMLLSGDLAEKWKITLPKRPKPTKRASTWDSLEHLRDAARLTWVARRCPTPEDRKGALFEARKRVAWVKADNEQGTHVESPFLSEYAEELTKDIRDEGKDLHARAKPHKPIEPLPYVFTQPVTNEGPFVGRRAEQAALRAAWRRGNLQPVVIHGAPLVGKTSLLNVLTDSLQETAELVRVDMQQMSRLTRRAHPFDVMIDQIQLETGWSPEEWGRTPHQHFQHYIHTVCGELGERSLILALDGVDDLIADSRRTREIDELLAYLWHLMQVESSLAIALVVTQPLLLLHEQSDSEFFKLDPMHLEHLREKEALHLLRAPQPKYLPYMRKVAFDVAQHYTNGHPYLLQLLGHHLVARLNQQLRSGEPRAPIFAPQDVRHALEQTDFRSNAQRYYRRVLDQVQRAGGCGERVLRLLANSASGLTEGQVVAALNIDYSEIKRALTILNEESTIAHNEQSGRWRVRVPLLREWLKENEE